MRISEILDLMESIENSQQQENLSDFVGDLTGIRSGLRKSFSTIKNMDLPSNMDGNSELEEDLMSLSDIDEGIGSMVRGGLIAGALGLSSLGAAAQATSQDMAQDLARCAAVQTRAAAESFNASQGKNMSQAEEMMAFAKDLQNAAGKLLGPDETMTIMKRQYSFLNHLKKNEPHKYMPTLANAIKGCDKTIDKFVTMVKAEAGQSQQPQAAQPQQSKPAQQSQSNEVKTVKITSGGEFTGTLHPNGKPAEGTSKFKDGTVFTGKYDSKGNETEGTYKYPDGEIYQGTFRPDGTRLQGTYKFPDGGEFTGSNDANGNPMNGTYKKPNGTKTVIRNGKPQ